MEPQVISDSTPYQLWLICGIGDSHRGTDKDLYLLGHDAV